jgi:hypothetical protein
VRSQRELPGPPLPKLSRERNPFTHSVLKLGFDRLFERFKNDPAGQEWAFDQHYTVSGDVDIKVQLEFKTLDPWGASRPWGASLTIKCNSSGLSIDQEVLLYKVKSKIGGVRFVTKCPETQQIVRSLYLAPWNEEFRSRHALDLRYYSKVAPPVEQAGARVEKLGHPLGLDPYSTTIGPVRPKHMHRKTFSYLSHQLHEAQMSEYAFLFGGRARKISADSGLPRNVRKHLNSYLPKRPRRVKG